MTSDDFGVSAQSNAYNLGFQESRLDILPGLMPLAYVEGRLDAKKATNKPTKPGHTWVEDKTVKGGGYWRKLPKGSGLGLGGVAAAAAIAGGIALASRGKSPTPEPVTEKVNFPISPTLQPKTFPTKAVIGGTVAAGAAGTAGILLANRKKAVGVEIEPPAAQPKKAGQPEQPLPEININPYSSPQPTPPQSKIPDIDDPWGDGHSTGDWTKSPHAKLSDIDFKNVDPSENPWDIPKVEKHPFPSDTELLQNLEPVKDKAKIPFNKQLYTTEVEGKKYSIETEYSEDSIIKKALDHDIAQVMGMGDKTVPVKPVIASRYKMYSASPYVEGESLDTEIRRNRVAIEEVTKNNNSSFQKAVSQYKSGEISKAEYNAKDEEFWQNSLELKKLEKQNQEKVLAAKIPLIPKDEQLKTVLFDYVSSNARQPENIVFTSTGRKLMSQGDADWSQAQKINLSDKHIYITHGSIKDSSFDRKDIEAVLDNQKGIEFLIKKHYSSYPPNLRNNFIQSHRKRMGKLQSMLNSGDLRVANLLESSSKKDSLAYHQGRLDARVGKRPKKIKCKPGFEQRGAACQPITSTKSKAVVSGKSRKAGSALAGTLALVGAAAAGAAAASAYSRSRQQPTTPPTPLPPVIQKSLSKRGLVAAGTGGVALGAIATVTVVHKQRQQAVDEANAAARKEVENAQAASKKELETATNKLKAKHQEELNFANERITKTESKLKEKETQLKSYQDEAVKTKGELDGAKAAAEVLRSQLESTNSELQKHQANLEQLSSEAEQAKTASRKYQSELDKTRKQLSEQTKASEDKDEVIKQTAETAAKQQQELEKANQTVKQLTDKSKELDSQVKALHSEVESARSERDKAASDLSELRKNIESRISEGVNTERRRLEEEQSRKIGEIDAKHADRAAQAIAIAQRDFEQRLEAAQDPKPGSGFQKGRGDLIRDDEGIKLGASARAGSDFLSRLTGDQQNKLASSADKTVEDIYNGKLAAVQHSFTRSVEDIDKAYPNKVDDVSNRNLGYQGNSNATATERAAKSIARSEPEIKAIYENQYEKQAQKPSESGKKGVGVETDKQRETRIKGQLVKLGYLETITTQQRLRENVLQYAKKRTQEQVRNSYRDALAELHESAQDEYGNYTPSLITPAALKKFDDTAKAIHAEAKKQAQKDADRVLDPEFGKDLAKTMKEYIDNMADADIEEMLGNQILGSQKRLPGSGRSKKNDSVHYLAGKVEVKLGIKKKDSNDERTFFISKLLAKTIASVYPKVRNVTGATKKGDTLTGYFRDIRNGLFSFEISQGKKIRIEPVTRRDSDEELNCKPGYEQRGAACQKVVVSRELPPAAQSAVRMVNNIIDKGELPSRTELAKELGVQAREFFKNPLKAVKEGFERERKVKEAFKAATGKEAPTKAKVTKEVVKKTAEYIKENPGVIKEQAMFIGSAIGATAGGAVGGPIGELAGDLGGAMAVRAVFTADEVARRAHAKLSKNEAFQKASKIGKLKQLGAATLAELKSTEMKEKVAEGTDEDVAGWVAGNVVGKTMDLVHTPSAAAIAAASVGAAHATPKLVKAKKRVQAGEDLATVAKETAKEIFENQIKKGNEREAKMREAVNKQIKKITEPIRKARGGR